MMLEKPHGETRAAEEDRANQVQNSTVEADILKQVIRENWRAGLGESIKINKAVAGIYDEHAAAMRKMLNSIDYELHSMPNIVTNTKKMRKDEITLYLSSIEAIALGYYDMLDTDLTNLILIGLSHKAKDLKTVSKYLTLLTAEIERRINAYKGRATRESTRLDALYGELKVNEKGILRIFRRRKITRLRGRTNTRAFRLTRLRVKENKYSELLANVKQKAARGQKTIL
jgi:hypothetical protein